MSSIQSTGLNRELHVVFGTGPLGLAVMRLLLQQGKSVRMANRSGQASVPAEVEIVRADASTPQRAVEACQGASVVYHCMGLPYAEWKRQWPLLMNGIISGAAAAGAKLVYADNLYAYGPVDGVIREELPYRPVGDKTQVRAETANQLMEAHGQGQVRAAIGRGSDFYGPGVTLSSLGARVFEHLLQQKPVELLGRLDMKHAYIFIDDFARGLITLGQEERALGHTWHIPCAEARTTRDMVEAVSRQIGTSAKYRVAGRSIVTVMGLFNSGMREFKELLYQFEKPLVVDCSKYTDAFGTQTTSHEEAIRLTIDWYRNKAAARTAI